MSVLKFEGLLTDNGWISPAFVTLSHNGNLKSIDKSSDQSIIQNIKGFALPGFQNAHSHAFQYAMAGLAEVHSQTNDNFWSWRSNMYKLALSLNPDDVKAIASFLYSEMLKNGFTSVAEFHYLHHDIDGNWYANPAEMGACLLGAAEEAGIKITLIPIFYQNGGFGKKAESDQKRFICKDPDEFLNLYQSYESLVSTHDAKIGMGFHSLRAVGEDSLLSVLKDIPDSIPIHIHVSEQKNEVKECVEYLKSRPVEWLINNVDLNERWHLVHATHTEENEISGIIKSGANVVLCPSTEGNLGDGFFPFRKYHKENGSWSIGTDSHIGLNPLEELRLLDYGQRLVSNQRDTFISLDKKDGAMEAILGCYKSGIMAMGNPGRGVFEIGMPFDAVVFDASHPLMETSSEEYLASTILYTLDTSAILGTIVNGQWIVQNGKHSSGEKLRERFSQQIKKLDFR